MNTRMFILVAALIANFNISHSAPLREQRFQLSIERGPLVSVLEQFSNQTGLHIGREISATAVQTNNIGPFTGHATADEAMTRLLAGTDLAYVWRADDTIRLFEFSAHRMKWRSGTSTAKEASASIQGLTGIRYETGACANLLVGPFSSDEPLTAEAFWVELIKQHCPVIPKRTSDIEPGSVDRLTVAGTTQHSFAVPEMPRLLALRRISEQAGVAVDYLSSDAEEEQDLVGPISGSMSLNEALKRAMRDSVLRIRWGADDTVSVEPAYTVAMYADMTACPCNFGLPEMRPVESRDLTVTDTRLPPISEYSLAPTKIFDRDFIDATRASTLPELLNYLSQQSFARSRGYHPNGAQYFEGRGYGTQYSLVLIDGHRAYGSAGDPLTNAFDLNVVPLAAVERIEVSIDQPSLKYGTDAIGGTVNIVLKRALDQPAASLSLTTAHGGADSEHVTLLADNEWRDTKVGFVFDHLARDDLLGSTRTRWRDQNFTRFRGGEDFRSPYGMPPNVRAINGNLPGLDTSVATFSLEAGEPTIRPDETNTQSVLAYAGIEPEQERSSLYGFANTRIGTVDVRLGFLFGHHTASLQLVPEGIDSLRWGAHHPQNPFGADVRLATLLIGLPPKKQETLSTLGRLSIDVEGSIGGWEYSAFFSEHDDRSRRWLTHQVDPSVLAHSLTTHDPDAALNVLSDRPGEGPVPEGLLLPERVNYYDTRARQYGVNLSGRPIEWRTGSVVADVGVEHRQEAARFDPVGRLDRDITSFFSRLRIPVTSTEGTFLLRNWELALGARRDLHSDVRDVTTWQSSLLWQPHPVLEFHAAYRTLFRPPSLYELYLPRVYLPAEIFDPQRNEVTAITSVSGGNPYLHPTEAESFNAGVSIRADHSWKVSLNYWDTRMQERVAAVLPTDLLNAQDDVASRVVRDGRTGRVLMLDTTRANFGALNARGFDVSLERYFVTPVGRITPRMDITHTVDFEYRDLPQSSMLDRAGIASVYGTVPSTKAFASLMLEWDTASVFAIARHHTSYQDYSTVTGTLTGRRIPGQTFLDLKISKDLGSHLTLSLGAINVLDNQPPFAQIGGWEGFDPSQGDLIGREAFIDITGSF